MQNKEPTLEQIREFWEWCGLEVKSVFASVHFWGTDKDGDGCLLLLDLNNLFLWAVPKFKQDYGGDVLYRLLEHWAVELSLGSVFLPNEHEIALALFWALWAVMKEAKDANKTR